MKPTSLYRPHPHLLPSYRHPDPNPTSTQPSQSLNHLLSHLPLPNPLPERQRQIRIAIQLRYSRSRMNKEYVYGDDMTNRVFRDKSESSTHSSDMDEFQHLKGAKLVNLNEQNRKNRKANDNKEEYVQNYMKKFKIASGNNNSTLRKTEGDEIDHHKRIYSNQRTLSNKNDSPVHLPSKHMFKHKPHPYNNPSKPKRIALSDQTSKFRTLAIPYLQKSRQYLRYKMAKSKEKEHLSRDSSSSDKHNSILKSNLTLQVDFKKKYNDNPAATHYKNISSSTKIVPKVEKYSTNHATTRQKVASTGKMGQKDRFLKFLYGKKL